MQRSERPSDGFGGRLKKYRLMAGLSAQKLSDLLGGEISRGVIANIESGAKKDVTVDELISLAVALDVPPVMLAIPVEEPNQNVLLDEISGMESMDLVAFFSGETSSRPRGGGATRAYSTTILNALQELREATRSLDQLAIGAPGSKEAIVRLRRARDACVRLGVDADSWLRIIGWEGEPPLEYPEAP